MIATRVKHECTGKLEAFIAAAGGHYAALQSPLNQISACTYCHLNLLSKKVDQHTIDKWLIHSKDNQSQSLGLSFSIYLGMWEYKSDINDSNMLNPIF